MIIDQVVKILFIVSFVLTCTEQQNLQVIRASAKPLLEYIREHVDNDTYSAIVESYREQLCKWKYASYSKQLSISYLHFTRSNYENGYDFEPTEQSLRDSTFDSSLETVFVLHGYKDHLNNVSDYFDVKNEILIQNPYNVFVVNWTRYNHGNYMKVSVNAVLVGFEISRFAHFLMEATGIIAESIYVIGHSLGAQVAAFVGKTTPNLGRISGVDAAGPVFQFLPKTSRLTYTDAQFVDAIHTNGALSEKEGFGTLHAYADQDFFPNGGSKQPACENNRKFHYNDKTVAYADNKTHKISCNHQQSLNYFIESINSKCRFLSVLCNSYEDFLLGECQSSLVAPMGFHAKPIPKLKREAKFYLKTNAESPYCISRN